MYWTDPVVVQRVPSSAPPLSEPENFLSCMPGAKPSSSSLLSESRMFARSPDPESATLLVKVRPVSKKFRTLFGCATQGVGMQLPPVSRGLLNWQIRRPSSGGPQLSSVPSLVPAPVPSTYSNAPPEPCPNWFW